MDTIILTFSAGTVAGAMNALAGGGSFVSLPALIAAGVPSVQANASSTVALFPGGLASAWAYRDGLGPVGAVSLRPLAAATLFGGLLGALLLMRTSSAVFGYLLPWLLLIASLALAFGKRLREALRARCHIHANAVLAVQFALGVYGGYFGGAVGIMMIAIWGLIDSRDLKALNAQRTLLVSAANTVAVLVFIAAGAVHWPETLGTLAGAIAGGYFGAHIGRRASAAAVRRITLCATFGITLAFFVKSYGRILSGW
ncbi:sulfite exporter TauE/SafE family protein [Massilia endophytica]|uniref:sulfite exporter TauE/SafE family protein n=1 Tax=Massilia endophytica TaxID=2899220 RepID=UPI001E63C069|nr:sulfite exporter TauE/SafE family protein [Massilia endophytica]UGQ48576.1 sulfite exporter TauE/SafE family protein [Massilia endophytica]